MLGYASCENEGGRPRSGALSNTTHDPFDKATKATEYGSEGSWGAAMSCSDGSDIGIRLETASCLPSMTWESGLSIELGFHYWKRNDRESNAHIMRTNEKRVLWPSVDRDALLT